MSAQQVTAWRAAVVAASTLFTISGGAGVLVGAASAATTATQYTSFGLPMYPTPKSNIFVSPPQANGDGGVSDSVRMDPHAPLETVVAWYKARMPAGSYQPSPDPTHAGFQIGGSGDKVIRMVVLDHIKGHVQTDILC